MPDLPVKPYEPRYEFGQRVRIGRAIGLAVDVTSAASVAQGRATADAVLPLVDAILIQLAAAREQGRLFQGFIERVDQAQHITWPGPDGTQMHPDWCRECRVDQAREAARAEIGRRELAWANERRAVIDNAARLEELLAAATLRVDAALRLCRRDNSRIPVGEAGLGYLRAQDDVRHAIEHAVPARAADERPAVRDA